MTTQVPTQEAYVVTLLVCRRGAEGQGLHLSSPVRPHAGDAHLPVPRAERLSAGDDP